MTDLYDTILEAIVEHYGELGHQHGDRVIVDANEIKTAMVRLVAMVLACVDEDDARSRVLAQFLRQVIDQVNDIRASGEQAETFKPS